MEAIRTEKVGRVFKARRGSKEVRALADIDLVVPVGEFFGLLGPNGAGKTTLIKIFSTLLLPSEGKAYVLGYDVDTQFRELRWHISMVSGGETSGYGLLTVREQLWMFSQFAGIPTKTARRRIDELLEVVGLTEWADTRIYNLSTGMRQKMNLVRSLLSDPEVLFLDEPTLGLDVEVARDVRSYLVDWMKQGERTILLTTHYMAEADQLCDRIAIIHLGRILTTGSPAELKRQAGFLERYRIEVDDGADPGPLRSFGAVETDTLDGGARFTVTLDRDRGSADLIRVVGDLAGVRSFTREEPTLEDAFIALTGRGLEDQAPPA
ncbi:MAG TPA: ABC transporter ATP-binding protein [Acidimicrobiia bacterium]|nr:ABC transporter ATP-binding protein [Acidimicrobiia bacterium]